MLFISGRYYRVCCWQFRRLVSSHVQCDDTPGPPVLGSRSNSVWIPCRPEADGVLRCPGISLLPRHSQWSQTVCQTPLAWPQCTRWRGCSAPAPCRPPWYCRGCPGDVWRGTFRLYTLEIFTTETGETGTHLMPELCLACSNIAIVSSSR